MITLSLGHLIAFVLGLVAGWGLCVLVRRFRIQGRPCLYCNGNGYWASAAEQNAVMDATLEESRKFRP